MPRETRKGAFTLSLVTVVILGLVVVDVALGGVVRNSARGMIVPIGSAMHATVSIFTQKEFWSSRTALMEEIVLLKERVAQSEGRAAGYSALLSENEELRKMARLAEDGNGITAPVISSFRASPYGTFLIGAGREHGVSVGNIVIVDGGFVLGRVTDVTDTSATVRAIFAAGSTMDAVVDSVNFSLEGRGGGNARAEVPREAEIAEGATVMMPSLGGRPVGIIGKIESASSSVYSSVYVTFPFNLAGVRFVYVIPAVAL